jgi:hypothetical protein
MMKATFMRKDPDFTTCVLDVLPDNLVHRFFFFCKYLDAYSSRKFAITSKRTYDQLKTFFRNLKTFSEDDLKTCARWREELMKTLDSKCSIAVDEFKGKMQKMYVPNLEFVASDICLLKQALRNNLRWVINTNAIKCGSSVPKERTLNEFVQSVLRTALRNYTTVFVEKDEKWMLVCNVCKKCDYKSNCRPLVEQVVGAKDKPGMSKTKTTTTTPTTTPTTDAVMCGECYGMSKEKINSCNKDAVGQWNIVLKLMSDGLF